MIGPHRPGPAIVLALVFWLALSFFFALFPIATTRTHFPPSRCWSALQRSFFPPIAHCCQGRRNPPGRFSSSRPAGKKKVSHFSPRFSGFPRLLPLLTLPKHLSPLFSLPLPFLPPNILPLLFFFSSPPPFPCSIAIGLAIVFFEIDSHILFSSFFPCTHPNGPDHVPERPQTVDARCRRHLCEQSGCGTSLPEARFFFDGQATRRYKRTTTTMMMDEDKDRQGQRQGQRQGTAPVAVGCMDGQPQSSTAGGGQMDRGQQKKPFFFPFPRQADEITSTPSRCKTQQEKTTPPPLNKHRTTRLEINYGQLFQPRSWTG